MSTQDIDDYLKLARRPELQARFPALKKFNRKRTKLSRGEKWQITRAATVYNERKKPRDERAPQYKNYVFPADRVKTQERYKREAAQLASLDSSGEFKKLAKIKRKLTAKEKEKITKTRKATPGFEQTFPLSKAQAKKLPKEAVRGRGNVRGIKLSKLSPDARIYRATKNTVFVNNLGRRQKYIALGDPETNLDEYLRIAERELKRGARGVGIWTAHGLAGSFKGSMVNEFLPDRGFAYSLQNQFLGYVSQAELQGYDGNFILGIVVNLG